MIVPVLCGSALDGIGVQPLLDAVADYLPSPADMPPVEGHRSRRRRTPRSRRKPDARRAVLRPGLQDPGRPARRPALRAGLLGRAEGQLPGLQPGQGQEGKRPPALADPGRPPQAGRSGDGRRHRRRDRPAPLGHRRHALRHRSTRSCWSRSPSPRPSSRWPSSRRARPSARSWPTCWTCSAGRTRRSAPQESEETGQTLISGMGELHLEVIKHRLLRDYKLNVRVHKPRVSYRETIEQAVEVTGQCHRDDGRPDAVRRGDDPHGAVRRRHAPVAVMADCGDALPEEFLERRARDARRARRRGRAAWASR